MTRNDFQCQINRLKICYGEKYYNEEVIKLLWREVGTLDYKWFESLVDEMIASSKFAPTVSDFREQVLLTREKQWAAAKQRARIESKEFWSSTFHPDEMKFMFGEIKRKIMGQISDEDWNNFLKLLPKEKNQ